jgi:hypothetical protein
MPLTPSYLRLEAENGPREDYRIRAGRVETRDLQHDFDFEWTVLSPEQLREHVEHKTVLAQWLERRLGWRELLRACVDRENLEFFDSNQPYSHAAESHHSHAA